MLNALVRFSVRHRGVVIALACLMLGYGTYSLSQAKYDVFPEFAPPQVVIQTESPGLSPEQVEVLVTQPIENAVNGVAGIESLRSNSIQGLSLVTINFKSNSDIFQDRQAVAERLASLNGTLPQGVLSPTMSPLTSSTGDLMTIGLTSKTRSLMDIRTLADWVVKPRLLAVPGVAKVGVFGGDIRQLQIQLDPKKLIAQGLSVDEIFQAARRATGVEGAGFIDTPKERIVLQTLGQSLTAESLGNVVLTHNLGNLGPISVRLRDVATIKEGVEPPFGAAAVMGKPGVILNVWAQYGANTAEATKRVEEAVKELTPAIEAEKIEIDPSIFRAANFIEVAIRNVRTSLIIGAFLVIVVLFLFLLDARTTAISCIAIPLSLLTAVAVLNYLGMSLNTMTLGGLAIAIGGVVDDAIIDVENILRRLRENRKESNPTAIGEVIYHASLEVRGAVVYATFAVALVFVPILTMSGLAGRLFAPLGLSYIMATMASLAVALILTPALSFVLLGHRDIEEREPFLVHFLKKHYTTLLKIVEQHRAIVITTVVLLTLGGLSVIPFLKGDFLPELREGHFIVHVSSKPGTSLEESLKLGEKITKSLLTIPTVRTVAQRAGRAAADDVYGTHYSEFEVDFKPLSVKEAEAAPIAIRNALEQFPDIQFEAKTFLSERIEETLSGYIASVVVQIYGDDLDLLDQKAEEIVTLANKIQGATEVQLASPFGVPQLTIHLKPEGLALWGLSPVDVLDTVKIAYQGNIAGQVYDGNRVFNVAVLLSPNLRKSPDEIALLPLKSPTGTFVRLGDVAKISLKPGRYEVLHDGARRVQVVTLNVEGRDLKSVVNELKEKIRSNITFSKGTFVRFSGALEGQDQTTRDLLLHSLVAAVGVILLLSIIMRNGPNLTLVLVNLPFALVGGVLAAWISGGELSIGSLVGFVTLFGITLRNSIMMISHYEHLVKIEGQAWNAATSIRGATERLIPILMTALVTGLGLLPLAIGSHAPGREIEGPMAIVILGGLVTSTALNLLVLPALALKFGQFDSVTGENLNHKNFDGSPVEEKRALV